MFNTRHMLLPCTLPNHTAKQNLLPRLSEGRNLAAEFMSLDLIELSRRSSSDTVLQLLHYDNDRNLQITRLAIALRGD
jgi:hypothetical protein